MLYEINSYKLHRGVKGEDFMNLITNVGKNSYKSIDFITDPYNLESEMDQMKTNEFLPV
jgi:hypothetical protein